MEYCSNGSLADWLKSNLILHHKTVQRMSIELCRALRYLHQFEIIHRDVKPANILVSADGTIKLGDFGLAKILDKYVIPSQTSIYSYAYLYAKTKCGTERYMAPEVGKEAYGRKVDVFSAGCVLEDLIQKASLSQVQLILMKHLSNWMQEPNPVHRPTIGEVLNHPFFN